MPRVAVFGAGAFGGWTALELLRRGVAVQLFDAWGPGNPRSSSGGDTRVIRATYGSHDIYTRMAARALRLWRQHEEQFDRELLRITGALWMFVRTDPFLGSSSHALQASGLALEELSVAEAKRRYPVIDFTDISSVLLEVEAGYLHARRACEEVAARVTLEGGEYRQAAVRSPQPIDGPLAAIELEDGSEVEADAFVFACGPWLRYIFPDVIRPVLAVSRQEVYYFSTPAGDSRFTESGLPVWLEFGDKFIYGIPSATAEGGFKVADDSIGPRMNPTTDDRYPTPDGIREMGTFLSQRFPDLAGASLLRAEVCQYESTPDANFIIDRHPHAPNVWIAGGGSGHGFKMGPVVGEMVASLVLGTSTVDPTFALSRFATPPLGGWRAKWS